MLVACFLSNIVHRYMSDSYWYLKKKNILHAELVTLRGKAYVILLLWSPSITDDDDFLFNVEDTTWRGRIHVLTKLKVRRGCTVPSPLTWPSTKKSDGTKEFATTDSMDGCNVLPETQFVGTCLRVDTTWVLSVGGNLPPCAAAGERSDFNIKPPLGAPLLIFPRGYLLKSFPWVDTSTR